MSPTSLKKNWEKKEKRITKEHTLDEIQRLPLCPIFVYRLLNLKWLRIPAQTNCTDKRWGLSSRGEVHLQYQWDIIHAINDDWCSGVSSVMWPKCALSIWLPYRNGISPFGLIHTSNFVVQIRHIGTEVFAYFVFGILREIVQQGHVQFEFPRLLNFPRQVPKLPVTRLGRATERPNFIEAPDT